MPTLFVPREVADGERRVAATPDSTGRLRGAGFAVRVEAGAGAPAGHLDDAYAAAGAELVADRADGFASADVVCTVGAPDVGDVRAMRAGAVLVGLLAPHRNLDVVAALTQQRVTALAMELVPRITRAQSMDALSSQASLAGYRAVILGAWLVEKQLPLSMTAAGTIKPATVVVLGAGVAGLQAIATARRLGAVVRANDIREAAREEVESLGAEFISTGADAEGEGGYAREVDDDFLARQRSILGDHLARAHLVVSTAFVPGRPAPTLVTAEMVKRMRPGAVLVDVAAAEGGNCELTDGEETVEHAGVRVVGAPHLASSVPGEASELYGRNVAELVRLLVQDGEVHVDTADEIVAAALLVHDGEVVQAPTAALLEEGSR